MKEMGLGRSEWTVARVVEPGCRTRKCHPRRHAAVVALQPGRDHHYRGTVR